MVEGGIVIKKIWVVTFFLLGHSWREKIQNINNAKTTTNQPTNKQTNKQIKLTF